MWNAVNASKDVGSTPLPNVMSFAGNVVSGNELSQCFADFFDQKVKEIVGNVRVDAAVYNGERIVTAIDSMFMSRQDIIQCMVNIKVKIVRDMLVSHREYWWMDLNTYML